VAADEVAICVGRLAYKLANGQERSGFCSSWLTNLKEGDRVRFKLVSQPAFRLPLNLAAPVVMVAAGTGLAPFRVSRRVACYIECRATKQM
jgi:sulfite reductase alpha subunit-like flavoprotein